MTKTILLIVFSLLFTFSIFILVGWYIPLPDHSSPFEAIDALFSGLAFAGLIIAIYLQSKELELQRQELAQTRDELRGQKDQLDKQSITFLKDNFDTTFHQLLRSQLDIVSSMTINPGANLPITGRRCFSMMHSYIRTEYDRIRSNVRDKDELYYSREAFLLHYNTYKHQFDRYFNHLGLIVKYIDESAVNDKDFYFQILTSNLSGNESAVYFYYSLFVCDDDFRSKLLKYNFFKFLDKGLLLQFGHIEFIGYKM